MYLIPHGTAAVMAAAISMTTGTGPAADPPSVSSPGTSVEIAGYSAGSAPGFVIHPGTTISATWTEPRVIPRGFRDAYAELFAGFTDGNGQGPWGRENNMPQVGTDADSIAGQPRYFAWYSPAGPDSAERNKIRQPVRPGDVITATLAVKGPLVDNYTLRMTDSRHHRRLWTWRIRFTNIDDPAGIFIGAASPRYGPALLADFRHADFTAVSYRGSVLGSLEPGISSYNLVNLVNGYRHLLARASPLGASGASFTVTWHQSH